jgi:hypothetical protein
MSEKETSEDLCRRVASDFGGVCLLGFSRGKNSVGAWVQCKKFFTRIIPYHCWLVPGMRFEEDSLKYYEDFFQTKILSVPHPSVSRFFSQQVFTDPFANHAFDSWAAHDYQDVYAHVSSMAGVSPLTLSAIGVRSADSIYRRKAIMKTGGINVGKGEFYPCHDWNAERLERELVASGVRLPVDYTWWGRSFDGLDSRFTTGLKQNAPEDFKKLSALYPLAYADVCRMKWRKRHV